MSCLFLGSRGTFHKHRIEQILMYSIHWASDSDARAEDLLSKAPHPSFNSLGNAAGFGRTITYLTHTEMTATRTGHLLKKKPHHRQTHTN